MPGPCRAGDPAWAWPGSALLDADTWQRVETVTGGQLTGLRCLYIGAGQIPVRLADRVGTSGQVVVAGQRPGRLPAHDQLTVWNTTASPDVDGADPAVPFDLIICGPVLASRRDRRSELHRLAGRLVPGGVLLVEDWAPRRAGWVAEAPDPHAAGLVEKVLATVWAVAQTAGVDPTWAVQLPRVLRQEGMVAVDTRTTCRCWTAGSEGLHAVAGVLDQLRPRLLAAGLTGPELDHMTHLATVDDSGLAVYSDDLWSVAARRPRPLPM